MLLLYEVPKYVNLLEWNPDDVDNMMRLSKSVTKRLAMFCLNPFSFTIDLINPFQTLVDQFSQSYRSRLPYLQRFRSASFASRSLLNLAADSNKPRTNSSPLDETQTKSNSNPKKAKRRRKDTL